MAKKQQQKTPEANPPENYKGWTVRAGIDPRTQTQFWMADNGDRYNRRRKRCKTREAALVHIEEAMTEQENFGKTFSMSTDLRVQALNAVKVANGRATLAEMVKFWADRHPDDGMKITLAEMSDRYQKERATLGIRPATIKAIRQKMKTFCDKIGKEVPIAAVRETEVERFIDEQGGGIESRRAWKKILNTFFQFCQEKSITKTNPVATIKLPEVKKKQPVVWTAQDVESLMRITERELPEVAAGMAILFFAGLRPTELVGQYGLQHDAITVAKTKLDEAWKVYRAEKARLGLERGRGGDTEAQKKIRAKLEQSEVAANLREAQRALVDARNEYENGAMPGLQWRDVRLDDDDEPFISVRAETSKVGEARHVDILPNLVLWLQKYRKVGGPVIPNPTAFRRARRRIIKKMGMKRWTADVPRHSFASYHFKKFMNRDKLAEMLGHTENSKEIERHYKSATISKAEAEKFWVILPKGVEMPKQKKARASA